MITISGAGVAGLVSAWELSSRGHSVTVYERAASLSHNQCSWFAGGMLAPWCEGETAPLEVERLGQGAANWWSHVTTVKHQGTLVVAHPRDQAELAQFARRTRNHQRLTSDDVAKLEPGLTGRFNQALYFADEAYLDPRQALCDLAAGLQARGVDIRFGTPAPQDVDVDCRGITAPLPDLRPVRGEMILIEAKNVEITRTVRFLHPRHPVYLVPRGNGVYMIGATMIESDAQCPITVQSTLELLGAAYALHPGFGEASVLETGVGLRPAYSDNVPRLTRVGVSVHLNGLYRHGFLLAPALARQLATQFFSEETNEHQSKCCPA